MLQLLMQGQYFCQMAQVIKLLVNFEVHVTDQALKNGAPHWSLSMRHQH
jgi:hypothetical protein